MGQCLRENYKSKTIHHQSLQTYTDAQGVQVEFYTFGVYF